MRRIPGRVARGLERSGVSPAALGSGYIVFFTYSAAIGVFAIFLSLAVLRRERSVPSP
jgi:PAT family beta-lactamase induction signal transducer AmpG